MSLLDMRPRGAGGGSGAPADATFITQTPNVTLTNEQALSLLATGLLKNTTGTGVLSIGTAGTDYLAPAAIGVTVQAWDADLDTLAGLAKADGNFIVGDGAAWVVESGATARTSLGLGSLAVINSPLPIANGGSGQTAQQAAIDALTNVVAATNEHVLTKDTATGSAIFKAAAGGTTLPVADTQTIIKGSADATKLLRFEVDGFTAGATRVLTPPNADATIAGLEVANVFTTGQTINPGSDTTELILKAHSTKTTPFVVLKNSANTELMRIDAKNMQTAVMIGYLAGRDVTGSDNTLIGWRSGMLMTSATFNTAFGSNTLGAESASPLTGGSNAAFGAYSLRKLTSGTFNVGFGTSTLQELTTGGNNMAIGRDSLGSLVSGNNNVAIGMQAGKNVTANGNTLIGHTAGTSSSSGDNNTAVGFEAGKNMTGASYCVFLGANAGQDETGFSKLYISNIATATPLIYGEFTNGILKFHTYLNTDVVTDTLSLIKKRISGTPGIGLGTALRFGLHSSTTEDQHAARISAEWATATHASRAARSKWTVYDTAEREGIRIEASGTAPMLGFLGATAIARPTTYTLAGVATRTMPTPESAFTGQDNAQPGSVYAKSADLITLQTRLNSVEGVLRQLIIDLASTSGYGLLAAA